MILAINEKAIRDIADDGKQLYKSVSDLVLYATGAAECSTSDLLMVLEAVNTSLDDIDAALNRAYIETWRYIQVRIGYWKANDLPSQGQGDYRRGFRTMAQSGTAGLLTNDKRERRQTIYRLEFDFHAIDIGK
mgnify:CR=1 FL=1